MKRNLAMSVLAALLLTAPGTARALTISLVETGRTEVTVTVSGVESLASPSIGGFDFDLTFDDSLLAFVGVSFGSFLGGPSQSLRSVSLGSGVVDFSEVSLVFPSSILEAAQPDAFALATVRFSSLSTVDTLTQVALTQKVIASGAGGAVGSDPVAPLEIQAGVIPEASGPHVFALGVLLVLGARWLMRPGS